MALDETSQPLELLLSVSRDGSRTLGAQIEDQLRRAIRDRALRPGAAGAVHTRSGAPARRFAAGRGGRLCAAGCRGLSEPSAGRPPTCLATRRRWRAGAGGGRAGARRARGSTSVPACRTSRRSRERHGCARCARRSRRSPTPTSATATPEGSRCCAPPWRTTSAASAASWPIPSTSSSRTATRRASAWSATPSRPRAPSGSRWRTRATPSDGLVAAHAGLEPVPIGVDEAGTRVDELEQADADAVVLTPAHQHPTGVVLTGERRTALLAWLRATRHDRNRGRLRRRVPLRPRGRRSAPRPRPRPRRLRRLGEQDPGARAPHRLAGRAAVAASESPPSREHADDRHDALRPPG